jgi:pimeloyl-ACP methyl ester carboxylesterase
MFGGMDALARRAPQEGVQVLRPLYENLPPGARDRALAMLDEFDAASVAATSRFIASGVQPFGSADHLAALSVPTLLVRGDDPMHPAEVSDLYAAHLPAATVLPASTADIAAAVDDFLAQL